MLKYTLLFDINILWLQADEVDSKKSLETLLYCNGIPSNQHFVLMRAMHAPLKIKMAT